MIKCKINQNSKKNKIKEKLIVDKYYKEIEVLIASNIFMKIKCNSLYTRRKSSKWKYLILYDIVSYDFILIILILYVARTLLRSVNYLRILKIIWCWQPFNFLNWKYVRNYLLWIESFSTIKNVITTMITIRNVNTLESSDQE